MDKWEAFTFSTTTIKAMKPRMMSKNSMDYLFHHILGGHESSHKSIELARATGLLNDDQVADLLRKNSDRLIDRIKEFKVLHKLVCVFFALLFGYMQISCEDLEMRRAGRVRVRTTQRIRTGRTRTGKRRE
jgi:hypothetical protein